MSHPPFNSWLLDPSELTEEDLAQLEQHLAACENCRQLDLSLRSVDLILFSAGLVEPPDGFAGRFAVSLERRRQQRLHRRTAYVLALIMLGSLAVLAGLLALGIPQLAGMGNQNLRGMLTAWRQISVIVELGVSLLRTMDPTAYPAVLLWPATALAVMILAAHITFSVVWTALYLRLATQPIPWSRRP